jgi:glycosyltransferase involved in cell wall biosynthesis
MNDSVDSPRRTLFLTCNTPRDTGSGGEIVSWRLLRGYAELGTVDVIALVPPGDRAPEELRDTAGRVGLIEVPHFYFAKSRLENGKRFLRSQVGSEPFRIAKLRVPDVEPLMREWLADGDYDLLHCDYLSTAPYRELCPGLPAVLAEHNVEWQSFSRLADQHRNPLVRMALRRDSRRTAEWEARALGRFQHTLVLSELDRRLLLDARPDLDKRISVWPLPVEPRERTPPVGGGQPFTVLMLGSLRAVGRVHGLRWFLEEVWPMVRARVPEARLEIVGADPPPDIAGRDSRDGVSVHGFVDDLDPFLGRVDVCAIPLFVGAGIRVKVLELVSKGVPCVGSPVALQGLGWIEGCVEVDGREEWVEQIAAAATDRRPLMEAAARGAASLRARHSPQRATDHLRQMIEAIA